jgi:hypothetical protein
MGERLKSGYSGTAPQPPSPSWGGVRGGGEGLSIWQSIHWFRTAVLLDASPGIYLSFI